MNPATLTDHARDDVLAALERLELTEASLRLRLRQRLRVSNTDIVAIQLIDRAERRGRDLIATDLAPLLGLSAPAVTALTKRLEARGYITKESAPGNRRLRHLHVSDTARAELLDAMTATREKLQDLIDELDGTERRRTVAILDRVTDALDRGAPAPLTVAGPTVAG